MKIVFLLITILFNAYCSISSNSGNLKLSDGQSVTAQVGHNGIVNTLAISTDNQYFVTGGKDGVAKLWDKNGNEILSYIGHENSILTADISVEKKLVATGGLDGKVILWGIDGSKKKEIIVQGIAHWVKFTDNGIWIRNIFRGGVNNTGSYGQGVQMPLAIKHDTKNAIYFTRLYSLDGKIIGESPDGGNESWPDPVLLNDSIFFVYSTSSEIVEFYTDNTGKKSTVQLPFFHYEDRKNEPKISTLAVSEDSNTFAVATESETRKGNVFIFDKKGNMLLNLKISLKDDKILSLYLTPENKLVVGRGRGTDIYNLKGSRVCTNPSIAFELKRWNSLIGIPGNASKFIDSEKCEERFSLAPKFQKIYSIGKEIGQDNFFINSENSVIKYEISQDVIKPTIQDGILNKYSDLTGNISIVQKGKNYSIIENKNNNVISTFSESDLKKISDSVLNAEDKKEGKYTGNFYSIKPANFSENNPGGLLINYQTFYKGGGGDFKHSIYLNSYDPKTATNIISGEKSYNEEINTHLSSWDSSAVSDSGEFAIFLSVFDLTIKNKENKTLAKKEFRFNRSRWGGTLERAAFINKDQMIAIATSFNAEHEGDDIFYGTKFQNPIIILDLEGNLINVLNNFSSEIPEIQSFIEDKFIIVEADGTASIWDSKGVKHKSFAGNIGGAKQVLVFKESKRIATLDYANLIHFYDFAGNPIFTFGLDQKNNYLVYNPDNQYMLQNKDSASVLAFTKGIKSSSFENYDLFLNRPDVIFPLLNSNNKDKSLEDRIRTLKKLREYRIKQNGYTVSNIDNTKLHVPEVILETTIDNLIRKENTLSLSFKMKDEDSSGLNIIGYKIYVNGVPIYGDYVKRTYPNSNKLIEDKVVKIKEEVLLSQGDNSIEISCFTPDGVESPKEKILVKYEPPTSRKPDLYYIGIGVNAYDANKTGGLDALTYAVKDSQELKDTFEKSGKGKFANVYTKVLNDSEVTRENIGKLKDFLKNSQVDDQVIVFLSGHGIRKDTKVSDLIKAFGDTIPPQYKLRDGGDVDDVYYYMTSTANVDKPWENAIPLDGIRELVNGIPSRQKILLVDTCQSGEKLDLDDATVASLTKNVEIRKTRGQTAKTRGLNMVVKPGSNEKKEDTEKKIIQTIAKSNALKEMSELFPELRRGTGTIEISAATGAQSALESKEWQNGAFTFVIKEAILKGKAKDEKGNITARSLRKYVLDEVEKLTDGQQTPMVARDIAGRDFVIFGK